METTNIEYSSRREGRARGVIGASAGWLGICLAVFMLYREIEIPFDLAARFPPGTRLHLVIPVVGQAAMGVFAVLVCGILGALRDVMRGRDLTPRVRKR